MLVERGSRGVSSEVTGRIAQQAPDVDGLFADFSDPSSLISALTPAEAEAMIAEDTLGGGMVPKVAACVSALRGGVGRAHILNGTVPHALLLEVYTDEGVGTMIAEPNTEEA